MSGKKVEALLTIFLICLFVGGCVSLAPPRKQESAVAKEAEQKESEQPNRLISNQARNVAIDGFNIWFATDKGVSRYDRVEKKWTLYTTEHGLVANDVRAVAIDGNHVWFGTNNGISVYNFKDDTWKTYKKQDGLVDNSIFCITIDGKYVWIGTAGGLSRYDKEINSWATHEESSGGRRRFALMFAFGEVIPIRGNPPVTAIAVDGNYVWIGTYRGVLRYDKDKDSWSKFTRSDGLVSEEITAIAVDTDSVWFGTKESGVSRYSKTDRAFVKSYTKRDLLASNRVTSITVDGSYVWFGFANGGVQQYVRSVDSWRAFTKDDVLPSNHITTIASYGQEIWMGTYEDGIVRYDKKADKWDSYEEAENLIDNDVREISVDENRLWVATPRGLSRFDYQKQKWKNYKKSDGLIANYVTCLDSNPDGQVWIGTSKGLGAFDGVNWRFYTKEDGLLDNFITSIDLIEDLIYIGTKIGLSIAEIIPDGIKIVDSVELNCSINDVDKQGKLLWLATSDGLIKYDIKSKANIPALFFTVADGLPSNFVNTVKIWYGQVWVGTQAGLYVVKQDENGHKAPPLLEFVDPLIKSLHQKNVRAFEIGDEAIWAGTPQGVVRYDLTTSEVIDYNFENTDGNMAHSNVRSIALTGSEVWFGTCAGVSKLDKRYALESKDDIRLIEKAWTRYQALETVDILNSSYVSRIVDDDPYIWFGNWARTENGAIGRYDKRTKTWNLFTRKNLPLKSGGSPISRVRWIAPADDAVWIGTNGGLLRYDKHFDTWRHFTTSDGLPNNDVYFVLADETVKGQESTTLWLVHAGNVVSRYFPDTDKWTSRQIGESSGWDGAATIAADERYVWFTTGSDGLRRYDKKTDEWETIKKSDGLSSNSTHDVLVDGNFVWVTSWAGVSRYDLTTGRWKVYDQDTVIRGSTMWIDKGIDGVWVLYESFMEYPGTKYDNKTDSWYSIKSSEDYGSGASQVVETETDLWFATVHRGLHRYNKASKTWTVYDSGPDINHRSLLVDDGKVWTGTDYGLSIYDIENDNWTGFKQAEPRLPSSRIAALIADQNYLWCATSKGLSRYDKRKGRWKNFRAPDWGGGRRGGNDGPDEFVRKIWKGLISNTISCLALDENYLWVGTKYGVCRYDIEGDHWENYWTSNGLPNDAIRDLIISGYDVWVATAGGVAQYNRLSDDPNTWRSYTSMSDIKASRESKEFVESLTNDDVRCVAADGKTIWFGTIEGVSKYDSDKMRWQEFELPEVWRGEGIHSPAECMHNYPLALTAKVVDAFRLGGCIEEFASSDAVDAFNELDATRLTNDVASRSKKISCIETDGKKIWFGTARGLISYEFDSGKYTIFTKEDGLASNWITCIEIDQKEVWIGTASDGVSRLVLEQSEGSDKETGKWKNYSAKETQLPHNLIRAIEVDGDSVWIGTENGLVRYSRQKDEWTPFEAE